MNPPREYIRGLPPARGVSGVTGATPGDGPDLLRHVHCGLPHSRPLNCRMEFRSRQFAWEGSRAFNYLAVAILWLWSSQLTHVVGRRYATVCRALKRLTCGDAIRVRPEKI